jgi:hypothetical protein
MDIKIIYPFIGRYDITQYFGETLFDYSKFGLIGHNGIDYATPLNTPLLASSDGVIGRVGYENGGYGNYVRINADWGGRVITAHMNKYIVKLNQHVSAGDLIGYSGNTGFSSAPHLHFEVRPNTEPTNNGYNGAIDPLPYLDSGISTPVSPPIIDEPSYDSPEILVAGDTVYVNYDSGVNIRNDMGALLALAYRNTKMIITGSPIMYNNLKRYPVTISGYVAQLDEYNNILIKK